MLQLMQKGTESKSKVKRAVCRASHCRETLQTVPTLTLPAVGKRYGINTYCLGPRRSYGWYKEVP